MSSRKIFGLGVAAVIMVVAIILSGQIVEFLDAKQIMVIQYPSGTLKTAVQPGIYAQWFGTVTKYERRDQFWFSQQNDQGQTADESIPIRFNDGGHARISGSIAWEMPTDDQNLIALHVRYGSHAAIVQQLIRTVVEKSIYMTGPLMSSAESYSARRSELLNFIDDQIVNGVYKTEAVTQHVKDVMTGIEKTVVVVNLKQGPEGKYLRQDQSPLEAFGIKTFNLSINAVPYDADVEAQIKQQQNAVMKVQTAVAEAKEAEQRAITVEKNGQAEAAKSKWDQEVIKAKEVTQAEQQKAVAILNGEQRKSVAKLNAEQGLEVATLAAKAAEQSKQESILLGQGEAARKQLVMQADGALDKKLAAWVDVNHAYAEAIAKYSGSWVPSVVMGGNGTGVAGSGAQQLIDLLSAKTAKDLAVDMGLSGQANTKGQPQGR